MIVYSVWLNNEKIGTTSLETGDPPMGVAIGAITFIWRLLDTEGNLLSRGAIDEAGILVIRDQPHLVVKDECSVAVVGEFCYFAYSPELQEGEIHVCGIPSDEYRKRFPEQSEQYWGRDA